MKLTLVQKVILLSAVGIFKQLNNMFDAPPQLAEREQKLADWFEQQTSITGQTMLAVADYDRMFAAIIGACEAVIAAEEPTPETADKIVIVHNPNDVH